MNDIITFLLLAFKMLGKDGMKRKREDTYFDSRSVTTSFVRPGEHL
jgi:hypothetical protein